MGERRTKGRAPSGILLEEVLAQAHWLCTTSGYTIEVGCRFSVTEGRVQRTPLFFARAVEPAPDGDAGPAVHEQHWQFPTDHYKTAEALLLALLWKLETYLEHAA